MVPKCTGGVSVELIQGVYLTFLPHDHLEPILVLVI